MGLRHSGSLQPPLRRRTTGRRKPPLSSGCQLRYTVLHAHTASRAQPHVPLGPGVQRDLHDPHWLDPAFGRWWDPEDVQFDRLLHQLNATDDPCMQGYKSR
jgi:hypothetical protein